MSIPQNTILLFRKALLLWVLGYTASAWVGLDAINTMLHSPVFLPPGPLTPITHAFLFAAGSWLGILAPLAALLLILLCVHDLLRGSRWWTALLIWLLYINLMHVAWLAGSGGQQLMANLLFWNIFLGCSPRSIGCDEQGPSLSRRVALVYSVLAPAAFWIIRLQLLLAYLATGLHKLTGTHWLDGTAMGIVATDPAFGPLWIANFPLLAKLTTWAVLLFQFTFPISVWWGRPRILWMVFGIVFHLGTALWMDIPEMGLAFIAAYTIWLSPDQVDRLRALYLFKRRSVENGVAANTG